MNKIIVAFSVLLVAACGCSFDRQAAPTPIEAGPKDPKPLSNPPSHRDQIVTVNLKIASDDLDILGAKARRWTADAQGYVERQSLDAEQMNATLRIPSSRLESFLERVRKSQEVIRESRQVEDVTGARSDLEARLRSARTQEERLLGILRESTAALDDVLAVEQELGKVRERIETHEGTLAAMVNKIVYATVHISASQRPDSIAAHPWATICTSAQGGVDFLRVATVGLIAGVLRAGPTLTLLFALSWLSLRLFRRVRRPRKRQPV